MKISKILFLTALILISFRSVAFAANDEASVSASQIEQSLQDRIRRAIQENLNKPEVGQGQVQLKAFIGKIESLAETTISLTTTASSTHQSVSKQVITNDQTVFIRNKAKIKFADLTLQDQIIAMGTTNDNQTLSALRVVVTQPTKSTVTTEVAVGSISSWTAKTKKIILDTANTKIVGQEMIISRKAQIVDDQLRPLVVDDLETSLAVVAVVQIDSSDESFVVTRLLVFPGQTATPTQLPTPGTCGDKICQNVVCNGNGCPTPETPETCPTDCTKDK